MKFSKSQFVYLPVYPPTNLPNCLPANRRKSSRPNYLPKLALKLIPRRLGIEASTGQRKETVSSPQRQDKTRFKLLNGTE